MISRLMVGEKESHLLHDEQKLRCYVGQYTCEAVSMRINVLIEMKIIVKKSRVKNLGLHFEKNMK